MVDVIILHSQSQAQEEQAAEVLELLQVDHQEYQEQQTLAVAAEQDMLQMAEVEDLVLLYLEQVQ